MRRRLDETPVRRRSAVIDPEPSPGTPAGQQSGDVRIATFPPAWMPSSLGIAGAPSMIGVRKIQSVLDVYNGGYGVAVVKGLNVTQGAATAARTVVVFDNSVGLHVVPGAAGTLNVPVFSAGVACVARILGGHIVSSIIAAGSLVDLEVSPGGIGPNWMLRRLALGASPYIADTVTWLGQIPERGIFVPPGTQLTVDLPLTGAGEVVTVNLGVLFAPVGFGL